MIPIKKEYFCSAIRAGVSMLPSLNFDSECAFSFKTEFGDVAMIHYKDHSITLGIVINHKLVALFDYTGRCGYWSKRGEEQGGYWSKLEIYDCGMRLAELAEKEVAK